MKYYFAPMEGITDRVYRQLHRKYFPGVHRYYTPFFSPTVARKLTGKEKRELAPYQEDTIPQILTKVPEDFLFMAGQCADLGYEEINLNVGCPSGTVTAKGKGAGMLASPDTLDCFLEKIFSGTPMPISVKTRIGYLQPEEFPKLLDIFNRYPIKELIIHPRVRKDFYNGKPDMDIFRYAYRNSQAPVCYNGNIFSLSQIDTLKQEFSNMDCVMLGRGLLADPGMFTPGGTTACALKDFYEELLDAYLALFGSSRNAMFRLKEHWRFLQCKFEDCPKLFKALKKTTDIVNYRAITADVFKNVALRKEQFPDW